MPETTQNNEPSKPIAGKDFITFVLEDHPVFGNVQAVLWITAHPGNKGAPGEVSWVQPINPSVDLVEAAMKHFKGKLPSDLQGWFGQSRDNINPVDERKALDTIDKTAGNNISNATGGWTFERIITLVINKEKDFVNYRGMEFKDIPRDIIDKAWKKYLDGVSSGAYTMSDAVKQRMIDLLSIYEGNGPFHNQMQTFMTCIDRYNQNIMVANIEQTGLTFITRPRLCLQSSNLRSQRRMSVLDVDDPNTIAFAIRALLDTNLTFGPGLTGSGRLKPNLQACPLINPLNPFMTPLMNALVSLNGLPDKSIESEKTYGGYQMEAQTFAIGGDDLSQSGYQLQLEFKELQGGIISSIFYFWEEYIRCVTRGLMLAYPDDIDEQCLNYTVSIYRFNLDPTGHYIQDWCKCTGCYPTSLPLGAKLQVNAGEHINPYANRVGVTFECNKVEYRDYAIFMDFNTLMRRYCPNINLNVDGGENQPSVDPKQITDRANLDGGKQLFNPTLPRVPWANFMGLPWITSDPNGPKLEFRWVDQGNPVFGSDSSLYNHNLVDILMRHEIARKIVNSGAAREDITRSYRRMFPEMTSYGEEYAEEAKIEGTDFYGCSNLVNFTRQQLMSAMAADQVMATKQNNKESQ